METLGEVTQTNRGFLKINFKDRYGLDCSLQQSSLATEAAIWLGLDDADPKVMASDAAKVGVKTDETTGWVPYPIPGEVLLSTRMHLNQDQVRALIHHLQKWLETEQFE